MGPASAEADPPSAKSSVEALSSRPPGLRRSRAARPRSFRDIVKKDVHVFRTVSLVATATPLRPGVPAAAAVPRRLPAPPGGARGPLRPLDADRHRQWRRFHAGGHTAL